MSWMQKLYRTYESILEQGVTDHAEPLTPVGHTIQNAHIVIVIDGQGNFQTARVMPPKTAILLPATECLKTALAAKLRIRLPTKSNMLPMITPITAAKRRPILTAT